MKAGSLSRPRWIQIAAFSLVAILICVGIGVFARFRNGNGSLVASLRPAPPILEVSSDDRRDETIAYQARVRSAADAILDGHTDASAVHELPSDGLPLLQSAIDSGNLSAARAQLIAEALKSESARLRNAALVQKRRDWFRKSAIEPFEKDSGTQSWAPTARVVIQTAILNWADDPRASGDEEQILWREARSCFKQQCRDPLILMVYVQDMMDLNSPQQDLISYCAILAAQSLGLSHYPAALRFQSYLLGAKAIADFKPVSQANQQVMVQLIDKSKSALKEAIADPDLPRQQVFRLFNLIEFASISIYRDRRALTAPMFEILERSKIDRSTVLTVQGTFNIEYAWDARGTGFGFTVSADGQRLMEERLAKAATALEQAWSLDPTNSDAATNMIRVELGQGQGRDRMELWFHRAMQANPDNYDACSRKLYYLEPKWYGDAEQMLAFGRECEAGGNWNAGIPYILMKAHLDLAHYTDAGWQPRPQADYFQANPSAWDDIVRIDTRDHNYSPRCIRKELEFARAACLTGHWKEADDAFQKVGPAGDSRVYTGSEQKHDAAKAHEHVAAKT